MTRAVLALAVLVSLVPACSFDGGQRGGPDARDGDALAPDARPDAMPGDPCLTWTFTPAEFDPCAIPDPLNATDIDLTSGTWTIDGDTGVLDDGGGVVLTLARTTVGSVDVISVAQLAVSSSASLRLVGSRPIVIASWGDIFLDGDLDARSTVAGGLGAGARSTCSQGPTDGGTASGGDGGGGGGGFGGAGGTGGFGAQGNGTGGTAGMAQALPSILQGGCPGADSTTQGAGTPGTRGAGGGAVMLVARSTLTIAAGGVFAGGAGGTGGAVDQAGGGGGGSGGMIKLEATTVTVTSSATLAANGGQGGGGSNNGTAGAGVNGRNDASQATSGNKEGGGGNGGGGGYLAAANGAGALQVNNGGGGGGGGVGFIVYRGHPTATVSGGTISPTAAPF